MEARPLAQSRNRGLWTVRLITFAGLFSALGASWGFANLAESYFSGRPPAPPAPPRIPQLAAPVQKPPPVVVTIVHHPGKPPASSGPAPKPAGTGPAPAPAPPAPPVCHSTPSKPC